MEKSSKLVKYLPVNNQIRTKELVQKLVKSESYFKNYLSDLIWNEFHSMKYNLDYLSIVGIEDK